MKRSILIALILFIVGCLFAQKNESITIKAGTRVIDYFPISERYLYTDFTKGEATFKNGKIYLSMFNYNVLSSEMEFINSNDTLIVTHKRDLISIVVAQDTFYYHSGYLQMIRSGRLKVYSKQSIIIKDILKKGAMGTVNRSAASESYDYMLTNSVSNDLVADIDMVLQKAELFFFSTSGKNFVHFNRKNITSILPGKKSVIKNYIKSKKIDFKSREDLLRLADFVSNLQSENS